MSSSILLEVVQTNCYLIFFIKSDTFICIALLYFILMSNHILEKATDTKVPVALHYIIDYNLFFNKFRGMIRVGSYNIHS